MQAASVRNAPQSSSCIDACSSTISASPPSVVTRACLDFAFFCHDKDEPIIIDGHLNVQAVCFWMGDRAIRMGGANSHKSWTAALSWFCGNLGLLFVNQAPYYQSQLQYRLFHSKMVKVLSKAPKGKSPIHIRCIWWFVVKALRIDPDNLDKADFDDLVNAAFLILYWTTMCRPGVIYRTDKSDPGNPGQRLLTGICWKHVQVRKANGFRSRYVLHITIPIYKRVR